MVSTKPNITGYIKLERVDPDSCQIGSAAIAARLSSRERIECGVRQDMQDTATQSQNVATYPNLT
jgi:hypothetical protein